MSHVTEVFNQYATAGSALRAAERQTERAKREEQEARDRFAELTQRLGEAIHASLPEERRGPGKQYVVVGGLVWLLHTFPSHKPGDGPRFALEACHAVAVG